MTNVNGVIVVVDLPERAPRDPESVVSAYRDLHQQTRDAWTFERDPRPVRESW